MNPRRNRWLALPLALSAAAALVAGCGAPDGPSDEATVSASAPSTPPGTPDPTPATEQAGAVAVPVASLETGVDAFARALLTGDMVALTRSFSPRGMQRAVALQDAAGRNAGTIVRVDVVSLDRGEPGAPADVALELEVQSGSLTTVSVMQTTWQAQPPHGAWQIVDLSVRP